MKTTTQILPGIKSIAVADCSLLMPHIALRAICLMPILVLTDSTPMEICGDAECRCVTETEGAVRSQLATLSFHTTSELPLHKRLAFIVCDVNGNYFLIGAAEPPYPKVKITRKTGTPSGDTAGFEVEVSHRALRTLIPCKA